MEGGKGGGRKTWWVKRKKKKGLSWTDWVTSHLNPPSSLFPLFFCPSFASCCCWRGEKKGFLCLITRCDESRGEA